MHNLCSNYEMGKQANKQTSVISGARNCITLERGGKVVYVFEKGDECDDGIPINKLLLNRIDRKHNKSLQSIQINWTCLPDTVDSIIQNINVIKTTTTNMPSTITITNPDLSIFKTQVLDY